MKAITFDYKTTILEINRWWEVRKYLVSVDRTEFGAQGFTVWYTPKFKEAA